MAIFAARYDERHGRIDSARARFKHLVTTLSPRLLEAVTAAANFERRQVCGGQAS
jgi:pre-mRNA-processing factor 39